MKLELCIANKNGRTVTRCERGGAWGGGGRAGGGGKKAEYEITCGIVSKGGFLMQF